MNRRQYLAGFGGGATLLLGGCIAASSGSNSDGSDPTDRPSGARRRVSIAEFHGAPANSPISFDVSIDDQWITAESTASFSIETRNESDVVREVRPAFLQAANESVEKPATVLCYNHKAPDFDIESYEPPCFGSDAPSGSSIPSTYVDEEEQEVGFARGTPALDPIEPGGSREESAIVVDNPAVDGCFTPGSYPLVDLAWAEPLRLDVEIESA